MTTSFFQYLLEASICLLVFTLIYRLVFRGQTHFVWMRFYLLMSLVLSLSLPFVEISLPSLLSQETASSQISNTTQETFQWINVNYLLEATAKSSNSNLPHIGLYCLVTLYFSFFFYRGWGLVQSVREIVKLIRKNPKEKIEDYWLVSLSQQLPAFSFLHYIFMGKALHTLTPQEIEQVKRHELVHVQQYHTLDLLFVELMSVVFWFHPSIRYLKHALQEVHEYLADQTVAVAEGQKKNYAQLLVRLASPEKSFSLITNFSNQQIYNRITMLMKTRTQAQKKYYYLLLLPLMASLLLLLSCIEEGNESINADTDIGIFAQQTEDDIESAKNEMLKPQAKDNNSITERKKIASIHWNGNTVYSDKKLSEVLGLKPGDDYDEETINMRLNYNPDNDDISSLYMNNGYLFFNIKITENPAQSGDTELTFDIYEGEKVKTDNIMIKGNKTVSKEEIQKQISIKSGAWFDRSALIASQKAIAKMGHFDPEKVNINPIPNPEKGTVDIEFILTEIKAKK